MSARTTNISRTIATLRGVLTGLYPELPTRPPQHVYVEQLQQQQQQQQQAASGSSSSSGGSSGGQPQQEQERLPYVTTSSALGGRVEGRGVAGRGMGWGGGPRGRTPRA